MTIHDGDFVINSNGDIGIVINDQVRTALNDEPIDLKSFDPAFVLRYDGAAQINTVADTTEAVVMKDITYGSYSLKCVMLQAALNHLGYDCGNVDGWYGPKTRIALRKYIADQSLEENATISTTLNKMIGDYHDD